MIPIRACVRTCLPLPVLLLACAGANAAPPLQYLRVDHSVETLIDTATANRLTAEAIPQRLYKLYPPKLWGFATEVNGGFDDTNTCVVSARAMLLPLRGRTLVYAPLKTAATFAAAPHASLQQCRELAQQKLSDAVQSVVGQLVPN